MSFSLVAAQRATGRPIFCAIMPPVMCPPAPVGTTNCSVSCEAESKALALTYAPSERANVASSSLPAHRLGFVDGAKVGVKVVHGLHENAGHVDRVERAEAVALLEIAVSKEGGDGLVEVVRGPFDSPGRRGRGEMRKGE